MIPVPSEFRGLEPSKYVMCLPCFPSPDRDARRFAQRQPGGAALRERRKWRRWRNQGSLQAFLQAFPNLRLFSPSFSKECFGGFVGFQGVARVAGHKVPLSKFFAPAGPLSPTFQTPPRRIPQPGAVIGSKLQIAISKFASSELHSKRPTNQNPGKLEVLKKHPSTNLVFPKQNRVGPVASIMFKRGDPRTRWTFLLRAGELHAGFLIERAPRK
jgi:hypothetical protein